MNTESLRLLAAVHDPSSTVVYNAEFATIYNADHPNGYHVRLYVAESLHRQGLILMRDGVIYPPAHNRENS